METHFRLRTSSSIRSSLPFSLSWTFQLGFRARNAGSEEGVETGNESPLSSVVRATPMMASRSPRLLVSDRSASAYISGGEVVDERGAGLAARGERDDEPS
jgi:hypothetical protein